METMTLSRAATTIKRINLTAKQLAHPKRAGYLLDQALEIFAVKMAVRAGIDRANARGGSPRLVGTLMRDLYAAAEV